MRIRMLRLHFNAGHLVSAAVLPMCKSLTQLKSATESPDVYK
jgi:hypothetical protein